jgi:hypothetical protein
MNYIENPKTKGSGVICAIPQKGICPVKCEDCFFQSGRSYLEPLDENLPNLPNLEQSRGKIVRVNDGNDSNNKRNMVMETTQCYDERFYNTSIPKDLTTFGAPVVLTVNPGPMTDEDVHLVDPAPRNLMFVRFRTNSWNLHLAKTTIEHYTPRGVPIVLTFMAYYTDLVHPDHKGDYTYRKRTLNSYWVITSEAWDRIANKLGVNNNQMVHTCGKNAMTFACKHCGTCLREYYSTKCRMEE